MGMNIVDDRGKGSIVVISEGGDTVVSSAKESLITSCEDSEVIIHELTGTDIISLDNGQYLKGDQGDRSTIKVGAVRSGPIPAVTNIGDEFDAIFDFTLAQGDTGDTGAKGDQGIPGPTGDAGGPGNPGQSAPTQYTWVKYANSITPTPAEMVDDPTGQDFVGIAYNKSLPESSAHPDEFDYTQYGWSYILGKDGTNGYAGSDGVDGLPGAGFTWVGEWPSHPTSVELGRDPLDGDTYLNTTDGKVYTYAGGWHTMLESGGTGPQGPQGAPGGGVVWQGEQASSPAGAEVNWAYLNTVNGIIYIYDGYAWTVMTSDGHDNIAGADTGGPDKIYITYHAQVLEPNPPTLEGDTLGWNPDPHSFVAGTILWCSQKVATDPQLGLWGDPISLSGLDFRGPVGFRGSNSIMVPTADGIWSDQVAAQATPGAAPAEWDVVSIYKSSDPEVQETKRYGQNTQSGYWEWLDYNYVFLGDVLVDGTVDGQAFNAATTIIAGTQTNVAGLSGVGTAGTDIRLWSGSTYANRAAAPFRVDQNGKLNATNAVISGAVTATSGSFTGNVYMNNTSITSANIVNGTISSADIGTAQITNAKIGTASVNTIKIGGNAVTVMVGATTSYQYYANVNVVVTSADIPSGHSTVPIIVTGSCDSTANLYFDISVNTGSYAASGNLIAGHPAAGMASATVVYYASAGSYNFACYDHGITGAAHSRQRSITAILGKR